MEEEVKKLLKTSNLFKEKTKNWILTHFKKFNDFQQKDILTALIKEK